MLRFILAFLLFQTLCVYLEISSAQFLLFVAREILIAVFAAVHGLIA